MPSAYSSSSSVCVAAPRRPRTELLLLGGGLRPGCLARALGTTSGRGTVRDPPSRGVELMILIAGGSGELPTLSPLLRFARFERNMFLMVATASLVPIGNARLEPCSDDFRRVARGGGQLKLTLLYRGVSEKDTPPCTGGCGFLLGTK